MHAISLAGPQDEEMNLHLNHRKQVTWPTQVKRHDQNGIARGLARF